MKYLWISLGWISVTLGFLGIFLPLLPTTPFLLLAAFSFSKGSEPLHNWLITHPKLGPPIAHWNEHRAISRTVKIYASVTMAGLLLISVLWGGRTLDHFDSGNCFDLYFILLVDTKRASHPRKSVTGPLYTVTVTAIPMHRRSMDLPTLTLKAAAGAQ